MLPALGFPGSDMDPTVESKPTGLASPVFPFILVSTKPRKPRSKNMSDLEEAKGPSTARFRRSFEVLEGPSFSEAFLGRA